MFSKLSIIRSATVHKCFIYEFKAIFASQRHIKRIVSLNELILENLCDSFMNVNFNSLYICLTIAHPKFLFPLNPFFN